MKTQTNLKTWRAISVFLLVLAFGSMSAQAGQSGSIVAWGHNFYGQLGDGTTTDRTTPVAVSGLSGMTAIAGGGYHSLGLKGCLYKLIGDNNNDCRVDLLDFASMAENWLIDCDVEPSNPACVPK
ncbi:hypothetical protein LCGC14_2919660 [marine sediment metagenome]|uniref:Uncharacterized protein n=1 Tax=marine sediment metagenome TaxID=412755 RepID=A0A0F8XPC8_9ZZZZ